MLNLNYGRSLLDVATRYPEATAIKTGDQSVTFAAFARRVRSLALGLHELGFRRGDGLAVWIENRQEFLEAMTATWILGGYVAPINPRLNPHEVRHQVGNSEARVVVASAELMSSDPERVALGVETLRTVVSVGGALAEDDVDYDELLARHAGQPFEPVDTSADDLMWLFYTSGTTGRPKGVMWSHRTYVSAAVATASDLFAAAPGDGVLIAAPATHGAGIFALFAMTRGATAVFTPGDARATPDVILMTIAECQPTMAFLTPTHIKMLMARPNFASYDLSSLKTIIYGGSVMLVEDLRAALDGFVGVDLIQIFGQGECCTVISALGAEDHRRAAATDDPKVAARLSSAGHPRSFTEVRAIDDDGVPCAPGEIGELAVRGPAAAVGYWRAPAASRETFGDGWVRTGDVGRLDGDGYVYVVDRKKDMIVSGGMNIYAREVEDALSAHDAVLECAVIGIPHPIFGESVCAVVVTTGDVKEEQLTHFVIERIAYFKKPQRYVFIDELPRNSNGKVQKAELRRSLVPA